MHNKYSFELKLESLINPTRNLYTFEEKQQIPNSSYSYYNLRIFKIGKKSLNLYLRICVFWRKEINKKKKEGKTADI